jgi:hypothetical protein
MKDVARSVVMGAAMISPGLLQACAETPTKPVVRPEPDPVASVDADAAETAATAPSATATATATATASNIPAPSNTVVRPRTDPSLKPQMPTRGFSGGARARA